MATDNAADETDIAAPKAQNPKKKKRVRLILLAVLAIAAVGGGVWYINHQNYGKYQQTTNDAFVQSDAVVISSKLGGFVEQVFVTDNQWVKKGDPLVQVDAREYDAQVQQAEAQIGVADANAAGVRAQISEQQAGIAQAQAQLTAAESRLRFARGEVARFAPLAASGAETKERLDQLRDQENQAAAQVATARAQLVAAQRRIASLEAQIGQAASQRLAAEAQLSAANVNLGSTVIRASIDGRVGSKSVQPGQFVSPGVRLMSLVPVHQLYVEANFKETQLGLMRTGQPVHIAIDALEGVTINGKIDSFSPGTGAQFSLIPPQNATGNFTKIVQRVPVRIAIEAGPETSKLLLPGMSVEVTVDTRSAKDARDAITREQEQRAQGR